MMIDKRLLNLCTDSKKYIFLTVLMNWISIVCNIVAIFLIGDIIDKVYRGKQIHITFYAIIFLSVFIIRFIANLLYGKFSHLASSKARITLRENIYKKLLDLGIKYNKTIETSGLVQVAVDGVEALEIYFGRYLPQFFYSLLAPITLFVVLSSISFKSALILMLCVPLIPMSIIAIMKFAKRILKNYWNVYVNLGGTFLENLQGLTTLKIYDRDEERQEVMNKEAESFRKITMKVLSMQLNSISIMDIIAYGGSAIGIIFALLEFNKGNISLGGVIIIILLSADFFIPLRLLGSFFHVAMNGISASDKIFNLLDAEVEKRPDVSKEELNKMKNFNNIEFNNVEFSYDGQRIVLQDINLSMEKGSFVSIVGESGSGKSTIVSLLTKNYKVNKGNIKFSGVDLNNIPCDVLFNEVALISTNSYIFNGTIKDNLLMGNVRASSEDINKALKDARLYDFVQSLNDKLETNVGEGGNLLSGGQKQRLALARAILANRPIMIFDEATSNIDMESEEAIWDTIYTLKNKKTILVISHRLANVINSDKIYVLDKGKIKEVGNHEELMKKDGLYSEMSKNQEDLENLGGENCA